MTSPKPIQFFNYGLLATLLVALPLVACEPGEETNNSDTSNNDEGESTKVTSGESENPTEDGSETGSEEPSTDTGSDSGDPEVFQLRGSCPTNEPVGKFLLQLTASYTAISGRIEDGVYPSAFLNEIGSDGDCKLYRRENPICIPPCEQGQTCNHDGMCIEAPTAQSVGTASFSGLVEEVSIEPVEPGFNYSYTELPHPGFMKGSEITLTTNGVLDQGLTLFGLGIAEIEINQSEWVIKQGKGIDITWTPSGDDRLEVVSTLNIDQHGNSPATIICHSPDTGKTEITAGLIAQLIDSGVSGFPSGTVTRVSGDHSIVTFGNGKSGCVDFSVTNTKQVGVEVEGHIACTSDADCPEGQHCDLAIQTCVDDN